MKNDYTHLTDEEFEKIVRNQLKKFPHLRLSGEEEVIHDFYVYHGRKRNGKRLIPRTSPWQSIEGKKMWRDEN